MNIRNKDLNDLCQMFNWRPGEMGTGVRGIYRAVLVRDLEIEEVERDENDVLIAITDGHYLQTILLIPQDL